MRNPFRSIDVPNQAPESSRKLNGPAFWFIAKIKNKIKFKKCQKQIKVRLFSTPWIVFGTLEVNWVRVRQTVPFFTIYDSTAS